MQHEFLIFFFFKVKSSLRKNPLFLQQEFQSAKFDNIFNNNSFSPLKITI